MLHFAYLPASIIEYNNLSSSQAMKDQNNEETQPKNLIGSHDQEFSGTFLVFVSQFVQRPLSPKTHLLDRKATTNTMADSKRKAQPKGDARDNRDAKRSKVCF